MIDDTRDKTFVPGSDSDPASPHHAPIKPTDQARAGVELGRMRGVLTSSISLAVVGFLAVWTMGR